MPIAPDLRDYLADTARRLDTAAHGQAGGIVDEVCAHLGWSPAKLYNRLRSVGWTSGRKTRSDKGTTSLPAESLAMLAASQRESLRANGKQILYTPDANQILLSNGYDIPVSASQINRLMRDRKLSVDTQRKAGAVQELRSLHPNHVHEVDPSLCVLYYMRGKQAIMEADKFYKNKWDNYAKVLLKVWRYVLWDHTSSTIVFKYFEAKGENPATLYDFLIWAWSKQPGREAHGVPKIMIWDKGSANTSAPIRNLCEALEVVAITHKAGAARVKGGVEGANNIIECKFESRLKLEPVHSVDELNAAALAWQNAFNADLIPHQDNRLRRNNIVLGSRYDLWRTIAAEQLRTLPDNAVEVCRPLLEGREETRKVSHKLAISYRHPRADHAMVYHLAGFDGINAGDEVRVRPLLFGECAIHIRAQRYDGEDLIFRAEPEQDYDRYGRRNASPIIGQEYKSLPDTMIEQAAKAMDALAYPEQDAAAARSKQEAPFGGQINAHSHLADIYHPEAMPRRGSEISVPMRAHVEIKPLNHVEAASRLRTLVPGWGVEHMKRLKAGWPEGVMEENLEQTAAALRGEEPAQKARLALVR